MNIDKLLRATRSARRSVTLDLRPDKDLIFLNTLPETGEAILLDTCVYIDQLQGRLPSDVETRIMLRGAYHSSLALSELSFPLGRLNPSDPRTAEAHTAIEDLISSIPDRRVLTPSAETKMRGAVLAGTMARVLAYSDAQRRKGLMDAMIAAQATAENLLFVTRNVADFDRLSQLESKLKVAVYTL